MREKAKSLYEQYKNRYPNFVTYFIIVIVCFELIYLLQLLYPMHPDDWEYAFIYSYNTDETRRITGILDIIESQYKHYFLWGGRVVVHSIAHFLIMIGKDVSNLINSIVYLILIGLMCCYVRNREQKISPFVYLTIFCILLIVIPNFSAVILWITGAANYLYGTLIVLAFLYPFYTYYRFEDNKFNRLKCFLMPFIGVIAGWTNENSAVGLAFSIAAIASLLLIEKRKVPLWIWTALIGVIIGATFMIMAPGNINRIVYYGKTAEEMDIFNTEILKERIDILLYHYYTSFIKILITIYVFFAFFYLFIVRKEIKLKKRTIVSSLLLFTTALVTFLVMIASPVILERSFFITNILLLMASAVLFLDLDKTKFIVKLSSILIFTGATLLFTYDYPRNYSALERVHLAWAERESSLERQKKEGKKDIVFHTHIEAHPKFHVAQYASLGDSANVWSNKRYARYKGVNSVVVIAKEK